jgi:hypothetical protein
MCEIVTKWRIYNTFVEAVLSMNWEEIVSMHKTLQGKYIVYYQENMEC